MGRRGSAKEVKVDPYCLKERSSQNFFKKLCSVSAKTSKKLGGKNMEIPQQDLYMRKAPVPHTMGVIIYPHHQIYNALLAICS